MTNIFIFRRLMTQCLKMSKWKSVKNKGSNSCIAQRKKFLSFVTDIMCRYALLYVEYLSIWAFFQDSTNLDFSPKFHRAFGFELNLGLLPVFWLVHKIFSEFIFLFQMLFKLFFISVPNLVISFDHLTTMNGWWFWKLCFVLFYKYWKIWE